MSQCQRQLRQPRVDLGMHARGLEMGVSYAASSELSSNESDSAAAAAAVEC